MGPSSMSGRGVEAVSEGVRDEGLRGPQDGQRVRALRAACDLHRASLGRGSEHASCDVDDVRGQAAGGAWRTLFLDSLYQILEADSARLARAAGVVRHLFPITPIAAQTERAAERVRVGKCEHALAPVDLEVADVAVGC